MSPGDRDRKTRTVLKISVLAALIVLVVGLGAAGQAAAFHDDGWFSDDDDSRWGDDRDSSRDSDDSTDGSWWGDDDDSSGDSDDSSDDSWWGDDDEEDDGGFLSNLLSPNLTVTQGYMQVGQGQNKTRFEFNRCPGGEPVNPSETCNVIESQLHLSNLTLTAQPDDIHFQNFTHHSDALGSNVTIVTQPQSTLKGTINFRELALEVDGDLRAAAPPLSDPETPQDCGSTIDLGLTTGESGDLDGGIVNPFSKTESGLVKLVDGEFSVPGATHCDGPLVTSIVNQELGLPSPSGQNEMSMNVRLDF